MKKYAYVKTKKKLNENEHYVLKNNKLKKKRTKVQKAKTPYIKIYKKLFASVREFKLAAILAPIFITLEVIIECIIPLFIGDFIDHLNEINSLVNSGNFTGDVASQMLMHIGNFAAVVIPLAVFSLLSGLFSGRFCATAGVGLSRNLRHDMFTKIQSFSFENIDKFDSSGLVTRMTTDVFYVQMAFMNLIRIAVRGPLMLLFSLIMAFVKAPQAAWIFLIVVPILAFGLGFIMYKAYPKFVKIFVRYDKLNESVEENIKGIRVVKSYVRSEYEKTKFRTNALEIENAFIRAEKIVAFTNPVMQFCIYSIITSVTFIAGNSIIAGSGMTLGDYNAMLVYGVQCLFSLMSFTSVLLTIVMSTTSAKRIYEVLEEEPTIKNCENPIFEVADGSVEFNNVSFKYSKTAEKFALSDVNLNIKSGETIGIIGGTGSSKSTFVNLLSRLYDVTEGSIKVGGIDVRNYDLASLRDNVSVVLQKNVLFSGTIEENLKWGNKNATHEEVVKAAKLACADEFITKFKDGYNHKIEQGGTNVSGGQKQRLCIARALLKNPKILILDDSTSAVDTKTDAKIRKAFREEIPNITKFIIAQRISSVQDSDRILVLHEGKINAFGTHEELLATNEIYQENYYSQTRNGGTK